MPVKNKKILLIAVLMTAFTSLLGFTWFADDVLTKAATQLTKWSSGYPPEKVYLHMDKPYYAIGDDIWFKAYVTIGGKHQLSALSGILNVELINDKDSVKKALKLPITAGVTWGDLKLTDSLREGNYRIRAYTNYMRNAGEDYFFDKTIAIGNGINNTVFAKTTYTYTALPNNQQKVNALVNYTGLDGKPYANAEVNYEVELSFRSVTKGKGITDEQGNLNISFINALPTLLKNGHITTTLKLTPTQKATKVLLIKATSDKADVQFFPESGNLINGIRNKVAFKAVGGDGLGISIHGKIIDSDNQDMAVLNTGHLGLGIFMLSPMPGKSYTAIITYPDGSESKVNLPKALDRGYVLSVNSSDPADVIIKVTTNEVTLQENQNTELNVLVHSGGSIIYTAKTNLVSAVFSARIPKSRFPSGIAQFTLFSATGEPLNERIAFIQNPDQLNIAINADKAAYAPREKVKLSVTAKNKDGQPVVGSFSMAVIDENKVPVDEANESTILSNLLLTSDIKGYIEKPNYYFTNVSDKTRADLDVLMLTQGYRRFAWKQIMTDGFTALQYQPEKTLNISGHIKTSNGKPVPNGKVTVFTSSGGSFLLDTVTDNEGAFAFKDLLFVDSVKFVIQARNAKGGKNVEIELDNISPQMVTANKNFGDLEVNVNSTLLPYLQNSKTQYDEFLKYGMINKTIMLKGVTISDKKAPLKNSANYNGPGNADQVIKSDQLEACATLTQCLTARVAFVTFRNGMAYSTRSPGTPMMIVVDGVPLENFDLDNLSASDVESVEVLRSIAYTGIYGGRASGGVLVITTKRGENNSVLQNYAPGLLVYNPKGYSKTRMFYSPQYDDPKTNTRVADLRTTIFWKPDILTDKNGASSVSYFDADSKGTYKVVIEGIDADGSIGRQVFRYKVE
jgi:hypothetical protein